MIPRIRTVKPEVFTHDLLWQLEHVTHLPMIRSYIALWCVTDRGALFEWKPVVLKHHCAPYDAIDFEHVLNVLANTGFVVKYVSGGRVYGWIPRFLDHQNINGREQASRLPSPPANVMAEHEQRMLAADFHISFNREQLIDDPPILGAGDVRVDQRGGRPKTPAADAKATREPRVPDVSSTRQPRVDHAIQPEQNRTEQNGTGDTDIAGSAAPTPARDTDEPIVVVRQEDGGAVLVDASAVSPSEVLTLQAEVRGSVDRPGDVALVVVSGRGRRSDAPPLPALKGKATAAAITERLAGVLAEVREGSRRAIRREQLRQLQAEFVFTYWAHVHDHPNTVMDKKRVARIMQRLEENDGDVNELLYVVDGAKKDRHLMGGNDRDRKYDGIETIFRDRGMVERLAENMPKFKRGEAHKMLAKWGEILRESGGEGD